MYIFRLFTKDEGAFPVDARLLAEGVLTVGRDPAADWVLVVHDREISRTHLSLRADDGQLFLTPMGANGVFDAGTDARLPDGEEVALSLPRSIRLGRYRMVADHAPQAVGNDADIGNSTLVMTAPLGGSIDVPTDWADAPGVPQITAGTMFDAFCEGAGIEVSVFGAEDPAEILRRAGAVYRQMVLGLGDLMAERDRVRGHYRLAHTTIGGSGNNPFKWAPTQRLAIDLLLTGEHGFLSGPEALKASFRDVKKHLVATFRGLQQCLTAAVGRFDPTAIAGATDGQASLLKGKAGVQWEEACRRHHALAAELEGQPGLLDQAFVKAYGAAETELERQGK